MGWHECDTLTPSFSAANRAVDGGTPWRPPTLAALNWLSIGIAIVDERRVLLRANRAATAILALAKHFRLEDGRVSGAHSMATLQLAALLRAALHDADAQPCVARVATAGCGELELLAVAVTRDDCDSARGVVLLINQPQPGLARIRRRDES